MNSAASCDATHVFGIVSMQAGRQGRAAAARRISQRNTTRWAYWQAREGCSGAGQPDCGRNYAHLRGVTELYLPARCRLRLQEAAPGSESILLRISPAETPFADASNRYTKRAWMAN